MTVIPLCFRKRGRNAIPRLSSVKRKGATSSRQPGGERHQAGGWNAGAGEARAQRGYERARAVEIFFVGERASDGGEERAGERVAARQRGVADRDERRAHFARAIEEGAALVGKVGEDAIGERAREVGAA